MKTANKVKTVGGYFQIWARGCGHEVRVSIESEGWERRNPKRARELDEMTRTQLVGPCPTCANSFGDDNQEIHGNLWEEGYA